MCNLSDNNMNYEKINKLEKRLHKEFEALEEIATKNQQKVLDAFLSHKVRSTHFAPSSGYAYGDSGRETLAKIYAQVLGFDKAIVSQALLSGTHTIFAALRGILRPGDKVLCITGEVYDSIKTTLTGNVGALCEFGITYDKVDMLPNGDFDRQTIQKKLKAHTYKMVYMQRACGYGARKSLLPKEMEEMAYFVKEIKRECIVFVDNCYGEFVCESEPCKCVDILCGSLIKNMGGGMVPVGGYIACTSNCFERIESSVVAPGVGVEIGANPYGYRDFFLGLFLAPHTVAQAKKSALLFGQGFADLGYRTSVSIGKHQADIVVAITLGSPEKLQKFCTLVQSLSPIDSFVTPEPWDMPGYAHQIIMSAGTFVAGATIELSADAPMREPYTVYLQGALTYEHAKIAYHHIVSQFE
ncbi:MAG: methionine gamma-lyase family protein [Firmicutes bacterium]|nr:methionine gamma-lyase family protein [Bacillota bacterium]